MKITTKHMGAIARHLADVLGDADTSRAEVALTALGLGDAATYADLAGVTVPVVSEGLRDAGVSVPALRRGTIAALFALVRPGAATCNRCGRLALRLDGSTWVAVMAPACPVDAGLYEAPAAAPTLRGWHDGRTYAADAAHDPAGVPLTEAAVRAERAVSPLVDAALRETGATLLDALTATVAAGASPAEALTAIGEPLRRWPSVVALRAFAAGAKGAASAPSPAAPSAAGAAAARLAGGYSERALRGALASLYSTAAQARMVARDAGLDVTRIDFSGGADAMWFAIISEARAQGRVGRVVDLARAEYPNSPAWRALDEVPAVDVLAALCRLLPVQFDDVVFRLEVPTEYMPGATAPQAERAAALVRLAEQQGKAAQLRALVTGQ